MPSSENNKILVTGGAGFIGPHLTRALLSQGFDVAVVDNLSTGKRERVPAAARFYECDIRSPKLAHIFALEQPAVVVHLAAQTNVRYSVTHPHEDADINIMGTLNVITASVRYGVQKFLFASSGGEVYGDASILPTPETHPLRPKCPYGLAKVFGEQMLAYAGDEQGPWPEPGRGLDWVALRLANVYGPGQDGMGETGITAILLERLLRDLPVLKIGDWTQTRDFVYIDDTVAAFLRAIDKNTDKWQAEKRLINIGTGIETNVNAVAAQLETLTGKPLIITENGPDIGAPARKALDASRAAKVLGWTPRTDLAAGLRACIAARVAEVV